MFKRISFLVPRSYRLALLIILVSACPGAWAQTADGNTGINQATTLMKSYFDSLTNLAYIIAAIIAVIGAIHVFDKWTNRDPHIGSWIAGYFAAIIFIVIIIPVIKSFFGQ